MEEMTVESLEAAYEDDRGAIYDLLDGQEIRHVGLITCTEGAVRGNHYHEKQKQWMYIIEGTIHLYLKDIREDDDADVQQFEMTAGDIVYIPSGVVHTIESTAYTEFLDFNNKVRGADGELYEQDTTRVDDIRS